MKKLIITCLLGLVLAKAFSQRERKISTYLFTQYNHTVYDYTQGNNPWGIGLGVQAFLNNKSKLNQLSNLLAIFI